MGIWTDIKSFENKYQISNKGYVKSLNYNNTCDLNNDMISTIETTIENSNYYNKKSYYDSLED